MSDEGTEILYPARGVGLVDAQGRPLMTPPTPRMVLARALQAAFSVSIQPLGPVPTDMDWLLLRFRQENLHDPPHRAAARRLNGQDVQS